MFVQNLSECRLGMKEFKKFKKDIEMFLEGKENEKSLITKKLKVKKLVKLYINRISNYKDELCDSSKDFVNYLKNGYKLRNVFNKKYSDEEKINKNIVRDFISLYMNKDYANMKKNLKFYEQFVREIDSIKYEDVITAIKSAYLTKGKELEEIEKVNKIWDEDNRKSREKFLG